MSNGDLTEHVHRNNEILREGSKGNRIEIGFNVSKTQNGLFNS